MSKVLVVSLVVVLVVLSVTSVAIAQEPYWTYASFYNGMFGDFSNGCGPWSSDDVDIPHRVCKPITFDADRQAITLRVQHGPAFIEPVKFRAIVTRGAEDGRWGYKVVFNLKWGDTAECFTRPKSNQCTVKAFGVGPADKNSLESITVIAHQIDGGTAKLAKIKFMIGK